MAALRFPRLSVCLSVLWNAALGLCRYVTMALQPLERFAVCQDTSVLRQKAGRWQRVGKLWRLTGSAVRSCCISTFAIRDNLINSTVAFSLA